MLIGIDSRLGPDLLHVLASMGHGDTLAIVDGNYPAERDAKRLVRMNGHTVSSVLEAVLTVFPIETDQVTGWVPETERDIHLDLMKQVRAFGWRDCATKRLGILSIGQAGLCNRCHHRFSTV